MRRARCSVSSGGAVAADENDCGDDDEMMMVRVRVRVMVIMGWGW